MVAASTRRQATLLVRRRVSSVLAALLLTAPLALAPVPAHAVEPRALTVAGGPTSASDATPVRLDADLYLPAAKPAPAVLLAHGFGGSKQSVAEEARALADAGFVVLAYSARGFGASAGSISLNSPAFEVADASALVTFLAGRSEVRRDGPADPVVGVAGGSYGGALALLLAGHDQRVDAVAADITWNNLASALFPQQSDSGASGVFKQLWTGYFFSVGLAAPPGAATVCGRFSPEWCALYARAASGATPSAADLALMQASSPASVAARIAAPTLLLAGQADSLFPLDQADATARAIAKAHPSTPLKVVWHSGGHDGGTPETDRLRGLVRDWMLAHLADGPAVDTGFEVTVSTGSILGGRNQAGPEIRRADTYPGLAGAAQQSLALGGPPQRVVAPPGGVPAAITVIPGLGSTAAALLSRGLPGQTAWFSTAPMTEHVDIVGSSSVRLAVASDVPVRDVVLFASLRVVAASGREVLPNGLVAPIHLAEVGPTPTVVTVRLPGIVAGVEPGESIRLAVSTTDAGYRLPQQAAVYTVALAQPAIAIATADLQPLTAPVAAGWWIGGALLIALLVAIAVRLLRPRHHRGDVREDLREVPLAVVDLAKEFKGGVRAVDGLSFQIPPHQVIGLLGPNGAGKTTTMRMAMGLIRPSQGDAYVFGERVLPGEPVLSRIGALIEGPGFLPHLTGRENLDLYWKAAGRTGDDPHLDDVLEIAGLGNAVHRKVRTYSQGMRQRLGIAQAMLGLPDLLVLDEPTNGLDPTQIRAMRQVLHDYAATGRTVIVSSHLLAEVEQTCTHVVIMNRGRLVATGPVQELLHGRGDVRLEDFFLDAIGDRPEGSRP